jgi:hypothetical protein
MFYIWIVSGMI